MKHNVLLPLALATAVVSGCGTDRPDLDISVLPPELPAAVRALEPTVVKVGVALASEDNTTPSNYGSGIRLDEHHVLSAGHVLKGEIICGESQVAAPTVEPLKGSTAIPTKGAIKKIATAAAILDSTTDAALLTLDPTIRGEFNQFDPAQVPVIRDTKARPIQPGEALYAFGYGMLDSSMAGQEVYGRTPFEKASTPEKQAKGWTKPRIIGAVVVGMSNGQIQTVDGFRDYAEKPDSQRIITTGDSGGPVFDAQGELVGIVQGGTEHPQTQSAAEKHFGVDLTNVPDKNMKAHETWVQPVSEKLLATLSQTATKPCVSR